MDIDSQKSIIICRLCFKIQDNFDDFEAIDDEMKDILEKVLQKMDFAAVQNPVMCTNCADTLMKCFNFKVKCTNIHDYIASLTNKKDDVKVLDIQEICEFCMSPVENCSSLSVAIEGDVALKEMIERCIPELDMNIIKKPVICLPCRGSLENYFSFMSGCLIVEEIIKNHCESQNMDSNGAVDLSRLLQFTITDVTRNASGSSTDFVKVKDEFCEEIENSRDAEIANGGDVFKFEQMSCKDGENCEEFELKNKSSVDMDELKFNSEEHFTQQNILLSKDVIKIEEPFCEKNRFIQESLVEMVDKKCLFNEDVKVKTDKADSNRFEEPKISKDDPKIHLLMNKDPLEVTVYKCELCSFQTKRKSYLKRHSLVHKDSPEVTMYKFHTCSFETKYEINLNRHLLKHMDPLEVTMYKCNSCSFETKSKRHLQKHSWTHKDPSELTNYKCHSCSFETKHKKSINRHFLTHKDPSEVTMYKCDLCSYQAKCKTNLQKHALRHKDPSEVTVYKCHFCSFETKHKGSLNRHFLVHKDPSEVTMYKCHFCLYQSKCEGDIKRHLIKHKDYSEVTTYKCEFCFFQTKHKESIKKHLLKHKDPSEITMYKCDYCSFEAKHRGSLKYHSLKHKDPSEVTICN